MIISLYEHSLVTEGQDGLESLSNVVKYFRDDCWFEVVEGGEVTANSAYGVPPGVLK